MQVKKTGLTTQRAHPMNPLRFQDLLNRKWSVGHNNLQVVGSSGPVVTPFIFKFANGAFKDSRPHVFVCANDESAEILRQNLESFGILIDTPSLIEGDTSPFTGLIPSLRYAHDRISWWHAAKNLRPGQALIATVSGLARRTMPPSLFTSKTFVLRKGSKIDSDFVRNLINLGYQDTPRVEDSGQFASRGGIFDIFSPAHPNPFRIELFDDEIDTIRFFDSDSQRSLAPVESVEIVPARGVLLDDERAEAISKITAAAKARSLDSRAVEGLQQDLSLGKYIPELELLTSYFYSDLKCSLDFLPHDTLLWQIDVIENTRAFDRRLEELKQESDLSAGSAIAPSINEWIDINIETEISRRFSTLEFSQLNTTEELSDEEDSESTIRYNSSSTAEFRRAIQSKRDSGLDEFEEVQKRLAHYSENGLRCFVCCHTENQSKRLAFLLDRKNIPIRLHSDFEEALSSDDNIALIPKPLSEGLRLQDEGLLFLTDHDFFGKKQGRQNVARTEDIQHLPQIEFSDMHPGDYIVHVQHGVGIFDGLKSMTVQGIASEFIQLTYKDNDRLYLPVYRIGQIQKFTGLPTLDKLGGQSWLKTKIKVRSELRDIADQLLRLYAERSILKRHPYPEPSEAYRRFEMSFPYTETPDQEKAIDDVLKDLAGDKPMDRLVCGDVGFGKTEIAIRAAFLAVAAGKQAAVLVPTTVLAYQHLETFKKRLRGFNLNIESFSRFSSPKEIKTNLARLKSGEIQIAIGTHRLLSKDVEFKSLGLLILDEEQRFGVAHKEKIRKLRTLIDTMSMSATPIPRTLNMSLMGIRDLSLITTAPKDRLPIRTFICKFEEETIRKAILSEIKRGGQVFYVHNRVQSIYSLCDELRALVPEARIRIGHGQMSEGELEDVMTAFFKHEFDVLLSTTIIESGVDIPRANTMIIDRADTFGLSQLYQLRGRIGRSKERAYCYLLVPSQRHLDPLAQERLKVLQENSALGSGFRIAQHDLELRGAGNILGEEQSGHINAVGYELYLELLQEVLHELRGTPVENKEVEPEINLRIPALIPDTYVPDIRSRLNIYRQLSNISGLADIDQIESDLRDQFGPPPDQVFNLFGVMIIRRQCKDLGVRDISAGAKSLSLAFTDKTSVDPTTMVGLATREKAKYSLTPDSRLIVKMNDLGWQSVYEELELLKKKVLR